VEDGGAREQTPFEVAFEGGHGEVCQEFVDHAAAHGITLAHVKAMEEVRLSASPETDARAAALDRGGEVGGETEECVGGVEESAPFVKLQVSDAADLAKGIGLASP
jgi:hypothetical protein